MIKIENLTKAYSNHKGVYNISFEIKKGEIFGYLGPNGAGKTTTIRNILGFIKPQVGSAQIDGLDCWTKMCEIHEKVKIGYIPGEIQMPSYMTGLELIRYIYDIRKQDNWGYVEWLIKYWQFDPTVRIKRMSKGMKQKVGLVIAWMHNPNVLILDEPTSGLDPLMQKKFIDLIFKAKEEGKTVLISSHIFAEIEKTCDRVAIIRNGEIVDIISINKIKYMDDKKFELFTKDKFELGSYANVQKVNDEKYVITFKNSELHQFLRDIAYLKVDKLVEKRFTLEEYFLRFYNADEHIEMLKNTNIDESDYKHYRRTLNLSNNIKERKSKYKEKKEQEKVKKDKEKNV